jgi:hypothetical protein
MQQSAMIAGQKCSEIKSPIKGAPQNPDFNGMLQWQSAFNPNGSGARRKDESSFPSSSVLPVRQVHSLAI